MTLRLEGKRIAILVEEGFEDLEFWAPLMRMQEEGARVTVVGLTAGKTVKSKTGGLTATTDVAAADVQASDFDGLIVPGGWAPDKLRRYAAITTLVRQVYDQGKVVGMILSLIHISEPTRPY